MTPSPKARGSVRPSRRSAARLAAVQALYQSEMTGVEGGAVTREFAKHRLGHEIDGDEYARADEALFGAIVEGTLERQDEIDRLLSDALVVGWPLERLEMILRALLRAGVFELVGNVEVPARVIIAEYLDIAHAFFGGKEPGLANGILDRIAREVRAAEWA